MQRKKLNEYCVHTVYISVINFFYYCRLISIEIVGVIENSNC